eukprot:9498047-Pyramimonas_sp.AAC.3
MSECTMPRQQVYIKRGGPGVLVLHVEVSVVLCEYLHVAARGGGYGVRSNRLNLRPPQQHASRVKWTNLTQQTDDVSVRCMHSSVGAGVTAVLTSTKPRSSLRCFDLIRIK